MQRKTRPFTLPDGTAVLVRPYDSKDIEAMNRWVKKKYLENVRDVCYGLDEQTQLELRLAALNNAAKLTFQHGDGRDIVMGDIRGFAQLGYLLIENPPFSPEEYFKKLYPDEVLTEDGLKNLLEMMGVAYQTDEEVAQGGKSEQTDKTTESNGPVE